MVWTARILLLVCVGMTLWYGLYPGPQHPRLFAWDKAEHFFSFGALTAVLLVALPRVPASRLVAGLIVVGAGLELAQATPLVGREAALGDWLAEAAGVVIAAAPMMMGLRRALVAPEGPRPARGGSGAVDDSQHLFGRRPGGGEHPAAETADGQDGLADALQDVRTTRR